MTSEDHRHASDGTATIRVAVPQHLRTLAEVSGDVVVTVSRPVTVAAVVDALESAHPVLAGTIRDRGTGRRRAMIRVYADGEDYSDTWTGATLPDSVVDGREPLRLVGAIAGG
jgi:molybdopterin synthase sulfur carrier subunit